MTHAQFGDYGLQPGDGTASVSTSEAHQLIAGRFLPFLLDR
ncbi:alpha/beta hydrolase [Glutamicibacter mysorens]|nr:alpha/beta hydrolase [Glutamicibacter mysorens]